MIGGYATTEIDPDDDHACRIARSGTPDTAEIRKGYLFGGAMALKSDIAAA